MKKFKLLPNMACVMLACVLTGCHGIHANKKTNGLSAGKGTSGSGNSQTYAQGSDGTFGFVGNRKCKVMVSRGGTEQHYFFTFNSSEVNPSLKQSLHNQATYLIRHSNAKIRLEGNTDDRGSREYNVALGWRRTRAIMRQLKLEGVSSKQMELVSYGAEKPAKLGETESAWHCNRRVDLVFKK